MKRVLNKDSIKTMLIIALVVTVVVSALDLFLFKNMNRFIPRKSVYTHFNGIATEVIQKKNVDFLENSDILEYFTVTTNSKDDTISISLYGKFGENLNLELTSDYRLISLDRYHDNTLLVLCSALVRLLVYLFVGLLAGLLGTGKIVEPAPESEEAESAPESDSEPEPEPESEPESEADWETL